MEDPRRTALVGLDGEMSGSDIQAGLAIRTGDGLLMFRQNVGWDEQDLPWEDEAAAVHRIERDVILAAPGRARSTRTPNGSSSERSGHSEDAPSSASASTSPRSTTPSSATPSRTRCATSHDAPSTSTPSASRWTATPATSADRSPGDAGRSGPPPRQTGGSPQKGSTEGRTTPDGMPRGRCTPSSTCAGRSAAPQLPSARRRVTSSPRRAEAPTRSRAGSSAAGPSTDVTAAT